ncbi:hypothetical protein JCM11251_006298 [Rhodosporidiobolus azoricus]
MSSAAGGGDAASSTLPSSAPHDLAEELPSISFETHTSSVSRPDTTGRADDRGKDIADSELAGSGTDQDGAASLADRRSSQLTRTDEEKERPAGFDEEKAAPAPSAATGEFPDGGLRAWSVVAGAWCISFTSWGVTNSFGVFQTYYQQNQLSRYSHSEISWIGSLQLAMVLACAIFAGKFFDAGYIRYLLVVSTCIYTAGMFGFSEASQYYQIFLGQGLACGLASGIAFVPAASSISHWFKHKRATALGFLATGSSVGGMIYPAMLNHLFPKVGFGWTVRAAAFLTIGLVAIALLTINTRLPPRPLPKLHQVFDFSPLREKPFLLFVLGETIIMWGLYFGYYGLVHGVPSSLTDYSLTILNAASIIGRVGPGFLADRLGCLTTLVPLCAASGVLIFLFLPMCKTSGGMIAWCILFGISSGAYVSMMPATTASMTKDMTQVGHRLATMFLVISIAGLTGTPINGAIISKQDGSYVGAAIFSGVVVLIGTCFNAASWYVNMRQRGTWRV